jgi:hypothetical protein
LLFLVFHHSLFLLFGRLWRCCSGGVGQFVSWSLLRASLVDWLVRSPVTSRLYHTMDDSLYDEFGNYIGPDVQDSDDDAVSDEEERRWLDELRPADQEGDTIANGMDVVGLLHLLVIATAGLPYC